MQQVPIPHLCQGSSAVINMSTSTRSCNDLYQYLYYTCIYVIQHVVTSDLYHAYKDVGICMHICSIVYGAHCVLLIK